MATTHDIPNGDLNGNKIKLNTTSESLKTASSSSPDPNIKTNSATASASANANANATAPTNGQPQPKRNVDIRGANSNSSTTSTSTEFSTPSSTSVSSNSNSHGHSNINSSKAREEVYEDLKIIGHIKNIEKINEKRRIFLNNTISEYTINEQIETETKTGGKGDSVDSISHHQIFNETRTHVRETAQSATASAPTITTTTAGSSTDRVNRVNKDRSDTDKPTSSTSPTSPTYVTPFKPPRSPPPPKPPMNRAPSFGKADVRSAPTTPGAKTGSEPIVTPSSPVTPTKADLATATTVTTAVMPEPVTVTTVELRDEPVLRQRKICRPHSLSPEAPKQVSINHYDRLIEELKCPGCASPMKAPILLCKTGHSICEQCTRVLMLCPLCKEPFTTMRSLTVEALCSKAHFCCANAAGGCTVRLQVELLPWHEKQCIFKPMKCFMGRVWGDCNWSGREAFWKEHLESEHANKVFHNDCIDLIWNMGVKQKPLTGYYVFLTFDEMFNFYEIYDKDRVLFTMACTSTVREKKHHFAFEVTIIHQDNEALGITQKYPVHSEYDPDILAEGSCVSISMSDLAKFIDEEKLLHYRVRIVELKTPYKSKSSKNSSPRSDLHPIDFQQTQIEGVNLKSVPSDNIVTRKLLDIIIPETNASKTGSDYEGGSESGNVESIYNGKFVHNDSSTDSDPEFEAYIAKHWGTPQMHFNRKFLKNSSNDTSLTDDSGGFKQHNKHEMDDRASISSTTTSYKKRMTNSLRKSFRGFKNSTLFMKKSPETIDEK